MQQSRDNRDERMHASTDVLPDVADTLEHAAGNLAGVAEDLTHAARSLKSVSRPDELNLAGDSSENAARLFISPEVGQDVLKRSATSPSAWPGLPARS